MVVRVEERVTAVASPAIHRDATDQQKLLCTATFEGNRYVFYAVDSLVVVLHENHRGAIANNPRSEARRSSQFDLWQVWNVHESVACVRFNTTSKRVARGALALCLEEGRVVLMTPTMATSHLTTAAPPVAALTRTTPRSSARASESELKPVSSTAARRSSLFASSSTSTASRGTNGDITSEYLKVHLHLDLPAWQETVRWKADDDRLMDRLEWVESGDDLWLVGAGEKITTWKIVEESGVVAYQQLSFAIGEMDQRAWHMDVTQTGRFLATAGRHDRVLKLWSLHELGHDGTPVCLFLPHRRALVSTSWVKPWHTFKIQTNQSAPSAACEMLFTLDRAGTISIWRENVASPSRAFTLWKTFNTRDLLLQSPFGDVDDDEMDSAATSPVYSSLMATGLVGNNWGRATPRPPSTFGDVLLEETNVMAALSQFHYGYASLDEVRRNELQNQRMDSNPKANSKLLGGRTGMIADSYVGETFICGNMPLAKTFLVNLGFGVHANGDFSLFRVESIPFTGVSPRTSLLCMFSGLREQLAHATVYTVSSADYKDRENGSLSFFIELVYQPRGHESQLKVARLKLQAESSSGLGGGFRSARANVSYSVQMCEIGDLSLSVMSAHSSSAKVSPSLELATLNTSTSAHPSISSSSHLAIFSQGGQIDILRAGSYLGELKVGCRGPDLLPSLRTKAPHSVHWPAQKILFAFADGRLHATSLCPELATTFSAGASPSNGVQSKLLFSDDEVETNGIVQLIVCGVSASQKKAWSSAPTSFFFTAAPADKPTVLKDFCVVIALKPDCRSLVVWVFSVELPTTPEDNIEVAVVSASVSSSLSRSLQLFRRVTVEVPERQQLLHLASTPSLDDFETVFASVDAATYKLCVWGFTDMDEMTSLLCAHSSELTPMLKAVGTAASAAANGGQDTMMQFHSFAQTAPKHEFRGLAVSLCGRAALLFEEAESDSSSSYGSATPAASSGGDFTLCLVSLFDTWHESAIVLARKKYGQVLSIKWTPPLAPSLDSQIVFLTSTCVGVVRIDESASDGAWTVAWSSSRLTSKPVLLSDMTRFPQAYLSLGTAIADLNLSDLMGPASAPQLLTGGYSSGGGVAVAAVSTADIASNTARPVTMLFLLMRGSFSSLDRVLAHIKERVDDHEKTCYLKMLDDQELRKLPFLSLETLLGSEEKDERSATFTKGKGGAGGAGGSSAPVTSRASLARASDLFAMDFGSVRRSSLALGLGSGTSLLGDTPSTLSQDIPQPQDESLAIESADLISFFIDHKTSLSFIGEEYRDTFLELVSTSKKIVAWEKDTTRSKDEPALRFAASLLWPYKPAAAAGAEQPSPPADGSPVVEVKDAPHSLVAGICSEQVVWAALSDHQSELLQECFPSASFTLQDLTQLRVPFWLKSSATLMHFTEKAVQAEFASTRDPFRVALLYVLLGKTKLLVSLFKMSNESKIADLLCNDFSESRWKNAAVKNAYVLKAKRRHELSATFFLLGGKVQEAMSVAEHADPTLVLSFLIARLSEKWDLGGSNGSSSDSYGGGGYGEMSFTGLSSNMRTLSALRMTVDGAGTEDSCKDICKEYLKTIVWKKTQACGDVYMAFLVKYLLGEASSAIQSLLSVPSGDVTCMFDTVSAIGLDSSASQSSDSGLYWRVFGQSLLGAAEIVRYMKSTIPRMTSTMKLQVVHLQAIALDRLFAMGCNVIALYQQRDFATQFKQFCKENVAQSAAVRAAFLAVRSRILASVVSGQSRTLSSRTMKAIHLSLTARPVVTGSDARVALEESIDAEIKCLVARAGSYTICDLPEASDAALETMLKTSVLDTLHQAGRAPLEEFVFAHWNASLPPLPKPGTFLAMSPLQQLLEAAVDGIAVVAAGDLVSSATTQFHSKYIDQIGAELLEIADKLLCWLAYFFNGKRPNSRTPGSTGGADYIRVVTAAVYSIICVTCRYVKTPCCVQRALTAIFPHLEPLPKKTQDEISDIALADVCVYCSAAAKGRRDTASAGVPPLQRDLPVLYQIVQMLRQSLTTVMEEVRTNRLELEPPLLFFSYCQYWTLALCISSSMMPAHITKIAVDGSSAHSAGTALAKKLVQVWVSFAANLAKHSSRMLLCELTESYFRPFSVKAPTSPTGSTPGTPKEAGGSSSATAATSATSAASAGSTSGAAGTGVGGSGSPGVLSPRATRGARRDSRQLLRCTCDRCPWLLLLKMFTDKDELLLRISSQLEMCSEKIKDEISWGHLPDFPSKKAALTRSQKILLSEAAAGKGPELTDLLEKRILQSTPSIQLDANCIYRSEMSIKSLCFNRSTESAELVLCSSKGISRTASVEYSDGTKFQFKGMFANPQASFMSESSLASLAARRRTVDTSTILSRGGADSPQRSPSGADASGQSGDMKTPSFKPTVVESHPFLPLFVSGNQKGKIHLWSFESLSAVCEFQTRDIVATYPMSPAMSSRRDIKKIQFDNLGQQMGAVDNLGRLYMWKFANLDREPCYQELDCHDKGAKALRFINSSTIVATAGSSSDKRSVCMWDLLLPNSKALVAAPPCHSAGAASLAFSPSHQLLISGGESGSISVFDVRQRRVLHTITNAHETAITTLELHPSGRCVLSGSASGEIKIWSLPIFRELVAVSKVHAKPSFLGDAASNILGDAASNMAINVTSSSWGVTDAYATDDYFFTSGTDGSVQRFRVPSLNKLL